jgi:signal transduction histidine kinase
VLRVSDDGKGIPPNRLQTITSHGLASMRHRINALGGSWEVRSPGSGGTIMTAQIPLTRMLSAEPAA